MFTLKDWSKVSDFRSYSLRNDLHEQVVAVIPCATIKEARALVKAHSPRPKPAKKREGWRYLKVGDIQTKGTLYRYRDRSINDEWDTIPECTVGAPLSERDYSIYQTRRPLNRKDGR